MKPLFLLAAGFLVAQFADAQPIRFDQNSTTVDASCVAGNLCPVLAIPGTRVNFCTTAGFSTLTACLSNPLTTYTDLTGGTPCPSTAQLTPAPGGSCTSTSDNEGGFGIWYQPQTAYYYLRLPTKAGGGTYGPYPFSFGVNGQSSGVTYLPSGGTNTLSVAQALRANTILAQSFGAKCDGATNDAAAFNAAVAAAHPGDNIQVYSDPGTGCVIASPGITITKPITLQAGGPSNTFQFLAGSSGSYAMITIAAGVRDVTLRGFGIDAHSQTGVTGVAIVGTGGSPASRNVIDHLYFTGAFADAISSANSYFDQISNNTIRLAVQGISLVGSNSTTVLNNNFFMSQAGPVSAIVAHNIINVLAAGNTLECGGEITTYNSQNINIISNYFENQVSSGCPSMAGSAYVTLGNAFGGAPLDGGSLIGNTFNGSADYGAIIGDARGVEIDSNDFTTNTGGIAIDLTNQSINTFKNTFHLGSNSWNVNNGGDVESTHLVFINGSPGNFPASNATALQDNPILFPCAQPVPQSAHVPSGNGAVYWATTDGTCGAAGSLRGLWNNNGTPVATVPILDPELMTTGPTDSALVDGTLQVNSFGGVTTNAPIVKYNMIGHIAYSGVTASGGANPCTATAFSFVRCTNGNDSILDLVNGATRGGYLAGGNGSYTVPTTFSGLTTCNGGVEGSAVPITNSNTNTPGAIISGTGAFHGWAHCNGTNWVFSF